MPMRDRGKKDFDKEEDVRCWYVQRVHNKAWELSRQFC